MKKIMLAISILFSMSIHAAQFNCKVVVGDFDNTELNVSSISIQSDSSDTNIFNAKTLSLNILGHTNNFKRKALAVERTTKIDFELDFNKMVKATILSPRTPEEIEKKNKFNAILLITGLDISLYLNNEPFHSYKSLLYNLSCKLA